ncbi:helix-turn-helix domain-containing protein (plasmid) [Rhodococcus qingshengii]|uniref:helix-turn-helix domain-containing protein n=1 Tax=Rhodococcus qingshengii TaxID=334542 RepID=UPI002111E381|nr:helix-turn-helix domain-containing protein [Rhodococcus qingshengii]UUE28574.1 helix-turn-helix domain-containing protein [Rhodococcus qingshengii]
MSQKKESELIGPLVLQWPLNSDYMARTSATELLSAEWSALVERVAESLVGSAEPVSMSMKDEHNASSGLHWHVVSASTGDRLPGAVEGYLAATQMAVLSRESLSKALQGLSRDGYIVPGPAVEAAKGADEDSVPTETDVSSSWGPPISEAEAASLERKNLHLQVAQRREQLTTSYTRAEAADMLGVSPQTVSEMVAKHRLIGIKDGREWRFPAWQFTPDSAEPVLPELDRLVREFPGGVVSLSRWMNRPNGNFEGRTPQQEMLHDSDHVFAVVNSLTAA